MDEIATASMPLFALIASEAVGSAKATLSPSVESIVITPAPAAASEMFSEPPVKVNERFVAARLSITGSRPV